MVQCVYRPSVECTATLTWPGRVLGVAETDFISVGQACF